MKYRRSKVLIPLLTFLCLLSMSTPAFAQFGKRFKLDLSCETAPSVITQLHAKHLSTKSPDKEFLERVVALYAKRFDPNKSMLTNKEFTKLKDKIRGLISAPREKRCAGFAELKKMELSWYMDAEGFARKTLSNKKLKIDKKVVFQIDSDKRKRPKSKKEVAKVRYSLLHIQLANYVADGIKLEEAKKKLLHRYELQTKQIREMKSSEQFTIYLNAYANALDPHTTYLSNDALEDFQISMRLSLQGIGAALISRNGYTIVREIVPGGAADRQGILQPEDKIIAVAQGEKGESKDVVDMKLRDVVKLIRGKKGTKVRLTVLRKGKKTSRLEIIITRDKIDLQEQAAKLRWQTIKRGKKSVKLAIIELPSFYGSSGPNGRSCTRDVRKLLIEAKSKGAEGVMLDLSRNGGGLLQAAIDISGLFIAKGAVVGVKDEQGRFAVLEDKDPGIVYNGPLVVLTSSVSASASEILAGALKDYGRAVIVGDKQTYGKGTVQQVDGLSMGLGAIKVTTALFFVPGGHSTQGKGVASDVIIPSIFMDQDISEMNMPYALPPTKHNSFLSKGINLLKGGWLPVTANIVKKLVKSSKSRVAKNKEFQKLVKDIKKAKANKGIIKVSEILEEADKDPAEKKKEDKKKKDELSLQAKEGAQVLADLVVLQK